MSASPTPVEYFEQQGWKPVLGRLMHLPPTSEFFYFVRDVVETIPGGDLRWSRGGGGAALSTLCGLLWPWLEEDEHRVIAIDDGLTLRGDGWLEAELVGRTFVDDHLVTVASRLNCASGDALEHMLADIYTNGAVGGCLTLRDALPAGEYSGAVFWANVAQSDAAFREVFDAEGFAVAPQSDKLLSLFRERSRGAQPAKR